ncbi:MAG: zinc ribbon domain-containing protein, partial [Candidatus Hodarchaeota archaeon]
FKINRMVKKIECPKCGRENPSQAKFCFNCGNNLTQLKNFISISPKLTKYCEQCGYNNPPNAVFCHECGKEITIKAETHPKTKICPTCAISVSYSSLFCPNCNQSLTEQNSVIKSKVIPEQKEIKDSKECPACGLITKGDYCHNCGYHLIETKKRSSYNWWYCQRDSAIMAEVDQNLQIAISSESVDESLAQALNNNILQPHDREKAKILALQLLDEGMEKKFSVITKVRCPVCGSYSYAPVTKRPRQVSPFGLYSQLTLNAGNILRNGIFFLRTYPLLFVITILGVILDIGTYIMGLNSYSVVDLSVYSVESSEIFLEEVPIINLNTSDLITILLLLIIATVVTLAITSFIQCWYLTSLKGIRRNKERSLNLIESLTLSFRYFPRAFITQFIVTMLSTALSMILLIAASIILTSNLYELGYQSILSYLFLLLVLMFLVIGFSFFLSIFFAYVLGSVVLGDAGIFQSFKNSYKFARRYLATTFGVIIVFNFIGGLISVPVGMFVGTTTVLSNSGIMSYMLITTILSAIVTRGVEAYKTLSLGWAYDEFKSIIEV